MAIENVQVMSAPPGWGPRKADDASASLRKAWALTQLSIGQYSGEVEEQDRCAHPRVDRVFGRVKAAIEAAESLCEGADGGIVEVVRDAGSVASLLCSDLLATDPGGQHLSDNVMGWAAMALSDEIERAFRAVEAATFSPANGTGGGS